MENSPSLQSIVTISISEDDGFFRLETEGVSRLVFVKGSEIYKLSKRNSLERLISDLEEYKERLQEFSDRIIESDIMLAEYQGETYTCVKQLFFEESELKKLDEKELNEVLIANKDFLLKLLNLFFNAIENKEKYPDIVGYPQNPEYKNIVNLLLDKETGRVLLCDIGLSPHGDTLDKHGASFFDSENVKTYTARMREFKERLLSL